ncbi:MAG: DUF4097 family beta strand repeat protein [Clostridia bacterium]|nr:DUF4097 family beta strand repeat protein [Clostridia bacterium]
MKKITKFFVTACVGLTVLGAASGCNRYVGDYTYAQKSFIESGSGEIVSLSIDYENAAIEVKFDPSATAVSVSYPQMQTKSGKELSEVTVRETANALTIEEDTDVIFKLGVGINTPEAKISVVLPATRTYALDLSVDNGAITFLGDSAALSSLTIDTDNGAIALSATEVNVAGRVEMTTDNGAISVGKLTASALMIETDVGAVSASELFAPEVTVSVDVGEIDVTLAGKKEEWSVVAETNVGESNISTNVDTARPYKLTLSTDVGGIKANFLG